MGGVSDVYDAIAGASKPTTGYISDLGASAAYWLASAADEIVMNRSAWAGSIGAVQGVYLGDDDVVEIVSSQSPFKRVDFEDEDSLADVQREVDAAAELFIADVAKGRSVTAEVVKNEFGRGGMLLADKAVRVGMADRIASLAETISAASKSGAQTRADAVKARARAKLIRRYSHE